MSSQHPRVTPAPSASGVPQTRASDADRDAAASLLNAAFAEGRLTADEHSKRLSATYNARTWQQLRQLTADLPTSATESAAPRMLTGADRCLLCLLLILCPPVGIAWWLLAARHRPGTDPGRQPAASGPGARGEPLSSGAQGRRCC